MIVIVADGMNGGVWQGRMRPELRAHCSVHKRRGGSKSGERGGGLLIVWPQGA